MRSLPFFDAHNHVHLGSAIVNTPSSVDTSTFSNLKGMAVMSTHPRDFSGVSREINFLNKKYPDATFVPCYGAHPWFLDETTIISTSATKAEPDSWVDTLVCLLKENPKAAVGEIGLDNHRYVPNKPNELVSSMETQVSVFEMQMRIAAEYDRPVSVHAVKAWKPLYDSLLKLKREKCLPRRIYFHAFGGKAGVVDQILALLSPETDVFFGFAPCVNLRSPKTADVVRRIGIERIVLETDREDASYVWEEVVVGAEFISDALKITVDKVVKICWENSCKLYGIHQS